VSCGQAHSSARELVAQGSEAKLVAETLAISRSSLYYRRQPRTSRADRSRDQEIITACGEKPAYGYRRVVWWLGRHHGLVVNGKRALRVMRERGLLVRQRRFQVSRRKDWGKVEALHPNHVWQSDMTKVWAGPSVGWAYLVSVIDCCTREIVGWDLSLRCRTEEALAALNRAVLEVLPFGSRGTGLTLTTDNGTQFTSARYVETLNRLGITHRRTAYNHPEGNSYIERFHRSLKEEMLIYDFVADPKQLASNQLEAFEGFFEVSYRKHDYDYGRSVAQQKLAQYKTQPGSVFSNLHRAPKPIDPIDPSLNNPEMSKVDVNKRDAGI
jgi:putative transposase